jgi:hypothetical protein
MTVTEGALTRHEQGVALLREYADRLSQTGFERYRVDTLRHHAAGVEVRHHYAGGEWSLVAFDAPDWRNTTKIGQALWTVRPMLHRDSDEWPTVEELIQQTIGARLEIIESHNFTNRVVTELEQTNG